MAPGTAPKPPEPLRPQRLLHQAASDAARQHRPSGLGLDSAAVRLRLVERLRAEQRCHEAVCLAMKAVPRHQFVDSALATQAYEDTSLPIGLGQTISKPSVVARMLSLLHEGHHAREHGTLGRVLEIGTGCGYQTALIAQMATRVLSIERLKAIARQGARQPGRALTREHPARLWRRVPGSPAERTLRQHHRRGRWRRVATRVAGAAGRRWALGGADAVQRYERAGAAGRRQAR